MRFPYDGFPENFNLNAGYQFGQKINANYWHEALDVNDKGGGNSDLGKPLYAEADGVITSVHSHTTKPTFGKHYHLKTDGPWGTVWFHHAHCSEILVKEGDTVKEGQLIARIGNSGTDWAHDHWACKLQPTGVDGIAKTKEDLAKWTNPVEFVKKWSMYTNPPVSEHSEKDVNKLDKADQIKRAYKALTGEWVKQEEIDPWIKRDLSLDDTMIEIMKGDGRFRKAWIEPELQKLEEDITILKKHIEQFKDQQPQLKADEVIEETIKTYPTNPKNSMDKPKPVSIDPVFSGMIVNLLQTLKKKFGF